MTTPPRGADATAPMIERIARAIRETSSEALTRAVECEPGDPAYRAYSQISWALDVLATKIEDAALAEGAQG